MKILGVRGGVRDENGKLVPIYTGEPPLQLPSPAEPPQTEDEPE